MKLILLFTLTVLTGCSNENSPIRFYLKKGSTTDYLEHSTILWESKSQSTFVRREVTSVLGPEIGIDFTLNHILNNKDTITYEFQNYYSRTHRSRVLDGVIYVIKLADNIEGWIKKDVNGKRERIWVLKNKSSLEDSIIFGRLNFERYKYELDSSPDLNNIFKLDTAELQQGIYILNQKSTFSFYSKDMEKISHIKDNLCYVTPPGTGILAYINLDSLAKEFEGLKMKKHFQEEIELTLPNRVARPESRDSG